MIMYMLGFLFVGWLMSLVSFDVLVIGGLAELFGMQISSIGYHFLFVITGFVAWLISLFKAKKIIKVDLNNK